MAGAEGDISMDQTEEPATGVHNLPTEILMHIFLFLNCQEKAMVAQVCSAWRAVAYSPPLWQHQLVKVNLDAMCSFRYADLAQRGVQQVLILSCSRPQAISSLATRLKSLVYLDLRPCRILSDRSLRIAFSSGMDKLRVLKLRVRDPECAFVLDWVLDRLPMMEDLTLEGEVLNGTLLSRSPRLRKLWRLKIVSSTLTDVGVSYLCGMLEEGAQPLYVEGDILEHLALGGSAMLTDKALEDISRGFPNLVTLQLKDCTSVTSAGLGWLARLTKLRNFTLARGNIKGDDLLQLRDLFHGLVSLNLDLHPSLGDDVVRTVARAPHLRYLSLRGIILSKEAILRLTASLPRLRELALCPISPDFRDSVNASRPNCIIVPKLTSN